MARRRKIRRSVKAGLPAGTLVHLGDRKVEQAELQVFDYDQSRLQEIPRETLSGCLARKDATTVTWINVDGLHDTELIEKLGEGFSIHPLVLEDILNTETRPKLDDYETHLFLVVKMMTWDEETATIVTEQVSLVLGPRYLLTFQERGGDVFDAVRERLRAGQGRLRKMGADYLMYALLDAVVDGYFLILEKLDDRIETLDESMQDSVGGETLREVHRLKRVIIDLRKAIWPLREVLAALSRIESPLVRPETRVFLRDVQDHAVQVVETMETFRDLASGLVDLYMSTLNNRMNAVMKVLTVITTVFIPLTLIAGIYGMNFEHMPELHWRWGYPLVLVAMLGIAGWMLSVFKKRGWF